MRNEMALVKFWSFSWHKQICFGCHWMQWIDIIISKPTQTESCDAVCFVPWPRRGLTVQCTISSHINWICCISIFSVWKRVKAIICSECVSTWDKCLMSCKRDNFGIKWKYGVNTSKIQSESDNDQKTHPALLSSSSSSLLCFCFIKSKAIEISLPFSNDFRLQHLLEIFFSRAMKVLPITVVPFGKKSKYKDNTRRKRRKYEMKMCNSSNWDAICQAYAWECACVCVSLLDIRAFTLAYTRTHAITI